MPQGVAPGLYTIILKSTFDSYTLGASVDGSYFGQVYVSSSELLPKLTISPSLLFEGQSATVSAKIDYSNGTSVRYGLFMATVYPSALKNFYNSLTLTIQVPLFYDVSTGLWSGGITLPSAYYGGTISIDPGAIYYSGPYDVIVTGLSADGVPGTTNISSQLPFQIQPYLLISGQSLSSLPQTSGLAFNGDTIAYSTTLSGDQFDGTNTISGGSVTIIGSQINGTLDVNNADLTLVGVTGGSIVAQASNVTLDQSSVTSLQLTGSRVSMNSSTFGQVSPSLPSISVQSPAANQIFNGTSGTLTVNGQDVSSVAVYMDGALLTTLPGGESSYSFQLPSSIPDGVHLLRVVATQSDGLSTSASTYFTTDAQLATAESQISSATASVSSAAATISSLGSQLNSATATVGSLSSGLGAANATIGGLSSKLNTDNNTITNLTDGMLVLGAVAAIALVVGLASLMRKNRNDAPPTPVAPSMTTPPTPAGIPPENPPSPPPNPQPEQQPQTA